MGAMITLLQVRGRHWTIALEWKLADLWVGVFYDRRGALLNVWICVLPCLPIHLQFLPNDEGLDPSPEPCPECGGYGFLMGEFTDKCLKCNGTGTETK